METHNHNKPAINWKILHANIANDAERKYIEAFEIQEHSGVLMNGCVGRIISVWIISFLNIFKILLNNGTILTLKIDDFLMTFCTVYIFSIFPVNLVFLIFN